MRRRRRGFDQAGQVTIEMVGLVPIVAIIIALLFEILLVGLTYVFAGHSAREAARQLAVEGSAQASARADLPAAWRGGMQYQQGDDWVEVSLAVPLLFPGLHSPWRISTRAGTIIENGSTPTDVDSP